MLEVSVSIIKNKLGEYYIHKRSSEKRLYPNLYGIGAGGKVDIGESPLQAAKRELYEELGVKCSLEFLFDMNYEDEINIHLFIGETEEIGKVCEREFTWHGWVTDKIIDELISEDKLCPDSAMFWKRYKEEF